MCKTRLEELENRHAVTSPHVTWRRSSRLKRRPRNDAALQDTSCTLKQWRIPTYMYIYMIQSVCNTTSSTDEGCGRIHPYNICSCAHVHHCNTLRNCHVHVPVYDWSMTSRTCVWAGYNGRDIAITDDKSEVKLVGSLVDLRLWVHDLSMNFDLQLLTFCVDDL